MNGSKRSGILTALASTLALSGCKHDEPPPSDTSPAAASAAAAPSAAPAAAPTLSPAPEFHGEEFDVSIAPAGAYASGKPGVAQIVLVAKEGYHVNDKYPYKFKVVDSPGIAYKALVYTKDDVAFEEKRATMKVEFTPDSAGNKTIGGNFAFSVCSAEHCLVEKRDLSLAVAVN